MTNTDTNSSSALIRHLRQKHPQIGDRVGPYEIQDKIGVGSMGLVYKALDSRLQRHITLKFLPSQLSSDKLARKRFIAEAQAISKLDHPSICVVHDFGETEGEQMYMAMPFYEGQTIESRLLDGVIPSAIALDIAMQVADGLASAHQQGIIHRDIKPSNIMLTRAGNVKILDFGVAKIAGLDLTRTGSTMGTVAYMSPEQFKAETIDERTDVWALGATLFEMLTGSRAFPGKSLIEILNAIVYSEIAPDFTELGHIPSNIVDVVRNSLQRDKERRYRNMQEMLNAFKSL